MASASRTFSTTSRLRKSLAERLTETLIGSGHLAHSVQAAWSTKVLISEMMPISSASGMKMPGEIGPRSGWSQRHSASQLAMRIVSIDDDRLVDDAQRLGLDGAAQVRLHQLPVAERRVHRRLEQPPAVLAEFLGLVERKVGLDDHGVDVGVLDPRQHRAAAGLDAQRVAGDVDLALQAGEDRVEQRGQMALVLDPVEEDHELVAAEAADLDAVSLAKAASLSATA